VLTLEALNLEKSFGDRLLFKLEQSLKLYKGDRLGIIGANGTGKTTLLQLLAGDLESDAGHVHIHGTLAKVAQWEPVESDWSGGEETRKRLIAAFSLNADILFADEPTSHLDMNGIMEVEKLLSSYPGTVVLVSHDRELLDVVCTRILELENCKLTMYNGNYTQYREQKDNEWDRAWLEFDKYVSKRTQLLEAIEGKKKRAHRATQTSSRIGNSEAREGKAYYAGKAAKIEKNVHAIERRLEKLDAVEKPQQLSSVRFDIQAYVPIHGKAAVRLTRLTRTVPLRNEGSIIRNPLSNSLKAASLDSTPTSSLSRILFQDLSLTIRPGSKVVLLGSNGAGKSTLLQMIAHGDEGVFSAPSARIGYFHQQLKLLNDTESILSNVLSSSIYPESTVRTVLARLYFKREDVFKSVRLLSGGERVKTALAKLFLSDCNLLLLDEPTNYLDILAKEELEKVLIDYPGTILFATHDRRLAAKLADKVLHLENGEYTWYDGSYVEYMQMNKLPSESGRVLHKSKHSPSDGEELMRLELERSIVLSQLSIPNKSTDIVELDQRYKAISAKINQLES
jgi:macrolide transport system ATP-binding/permease protein